MKNLSLDNFDNSNLVLCAKNQTADLRKNYIFQIFRRENSNKINKYHEEDELKNLNHPFRVKIQIANPF